MKNHAIILSIIVGQGNAHDLLVVCIPYVSAYIRRSEKVRKTAIRKITKKRMSHTH